MKKYFIFGWSLFLLIFSSVSVAAPPETPADDKLPEIGSVYKMDRAKYYVRGVGKDPFKYTATGESLVLKIKKVSGAMVFVPKKGEVVKVDPGIPMVWVNGKAKEIFKTNNYLKKNAKGKVFLLLEYKRN